MIAALNVINPPEGLTISTPASTNPWTQVPTTDTSAGTDYVQYVYWHAISSAETELPPFFDFTFTVDSVPTVVRATGVAIIYENTCTQTTPEPCVSNEGSPILDFTSGTATASDSVSESSEINVQATGLATCAFGTSNTVVGFSSSITTPTTLKLENNNLGLNGGLSLYDRSEPSTGTDGPWSTTLTDSDTGDNVAQCVSIIPLGF